MGDAGWLVELSEPADVAHAFRLLASAHLAGARDLVPAACSVLVVGDASGPPSQEDIRAALAAPTGGAGPEPRVVTVPVRYDGPDLSFVAKRAGLSPEEVALIHAAAEYTVAFVGFKPGFPYLRGLPPELATPRLKTPRARVPPGSVAIGAAWTGIYPSATPGGWNLIATTGAVLFDASRHPPALLGPGDRVRFVAA